MEILRAALVLAVLAVPLAGCAVGNEAPGAVGYVLLDRDARSTGRLSHGSWSGVPVLPVGLDVAEPVAFSSSVGRTVFDLRPGMLAWVHGPGGAVEWRALRDDLRDDRLRVQGSQDAAVALAQRLAGQVVGPMEEGTWTIAAPDVYGRGSFLGVPEGVIEVSPEPRIDLGSATGRMGVGIAVAPGLPDPQSQPAASALVGVYNAGERVLFLDAAGEFALEEGCFLTGLDKGRWHTDGDRVILEGAGGEVVLTYDPTDGALRPSTGERFTSALVDSAIAAMPKEDP